MSKADWAQSPTIFGCSAPELSGAERDFFRAVRPAGFILFGRNCESPDQVRRLTTALRDAIGAPDAPVLIDQEGGRVARLRSPHWRHPPAANLFGNLYARDRAAGLEACRLNARLIAYELHTIGVDVDCAPVLDVPATGSHDIIGDRAFARDPATVAALGRAMAEGLLEGGVAPVIKHIPGHGRARADSHEALPTVEEARDVLERIDFAPFCALAEMPWAMTAHILYTGIDREAPATASRPIISDVIRGLIGFSGVLLTDDLSMKALSGTLAERARRSLGAGCDLALHCSGKLDEMAEVAAGAGVFPPESRARVAAALARVKTPGRFDAARAAERLAALIAPVA